MRSSHAVWILAVIGAVLAAGTTGLGQQAKVDVTGKWAFTVQSQNGPGMPTVTFKQDGEKLTGHYSSMLLGETDFTGSIKGQAIEFTVVADVQGLKIEATFTGTVESNDAMAGKFSAGDFGGGTFTGKRQ